MGFRGEALPSIASVSRFVLTTLERASDSPEGTQIVVNGGKILEVKAAGCSPGTSVEVRQLFFNLPARRKFLRTEETETAHTQHYVTLAALAFPEVAFSFQKDGRLVWQLPAVKSGADQRLRLDALRERLRALYGSEPNLLAVDFATELQSAAEPDQSDPPPSTLFRLWGYLGAPGVSRSTREDQHLFVNRRPVENRGLNFALLEGYHTALMKGRYPVCCLFLEIDPGAVDVNVHPTKREVRFHREADLRRLVAQAVRQTLLDFHTGAPKLPGQSAPPRGAKSALGSVRGVSATPAVEQAGLPDFPALPESPESRAPKPSGMPPGSSPGPISTLSASAQTEPSPTFPATGLQFFPPSSPRAPGEAPAGFTQPISGDTPRPPLPSVSAAADRGLPGAPVPLLNVPLRLVGVIGMLYVVLESDRGLVLLDQHAAHERILFERMLERLEHNDQAPSQHLLLPETVELSVRDASFLRQQLSALARLGVGLSEFGERTFLLDALPPFVKVADARRFVLELVDELKAAGQEVNSSRLGEHTVAKTVCRHAVKANDPLAGPELENLVEDLRHCAMPYTCPHGRPTLIEMNFRELEKKFGRTQ
jgi:DNA mismatch repair protein MutL